MTLLWLIRFLMRPTQEKQDAMCVYAYVRDVETRAEHDIVPLSGRQRCYMPHPV